MRAYCLIIFLLANAGAEAQQMSTVAANHNRLVDTSRIASAGPFSTTPEILSSGFIDVINNGQLNASARLVRLFIGEPGKFAIPLSIYSGVSSNNFQNLQLPGGMRSNEHLLSSFINPLSGMVNVSADGLILLSAKKRGITKTGFLFQSGVRILTGYRSGSLSDPAAGQPVNFLNQFGVAGWYIQTGAWERNNSGEMGKCWLALRYIYSNSAVRQLALMIPVNSSGFYHGWSLAWGVEISRLINIRAIFYKYVREPELNYALPIYQFSFHYSMK